jgi:hypothetical protein
VREEEGSPIVECRKYDVDWRYSNSEGEKVKEQARFGAKNDYIGLAYLFEFISLFQTALNNM